MIQHRRALVLSLGLLVGTALPARAGDDWKKSFQEKFSSKNSWERASAIAGLDAADANQLKMLIKVAETETWYERYAVADNLAKTTDTKALDELKKQLKSGKPLAAEVVATALGRSKDTVHVDVLAEALKKASDFRVRRACAIALGNLPHKKAVSALIEALEKEAKTFMVQVHVLESLERVTLEKNNKTPADWKGWWTGAEPNWTPPSADGDKDDDKKKSGEVIRTTVRGTDLDFRSRGKGRPLLVLPEYGYEKDYFETYLRNLEETNQILYMKLPGTADFNPKLENAPNLPMPYYPIDRIVESLEELRAELIKQKKLEDKPYAIFGHGISAWVAVRYASKAPKGVSRLVLCSTFASGRAFSRDLKKMLDDGKKTGDQELEHYAQSLSYNSQSGKSEYEATGREDSLALQRKAWTTYFGDWQDLEIGRIFGPMVQKPGVGEPIPAVQRVMGGCFVPDFDMAKEPEVSVPTLILGGANAYFGTPEDCDEISKKCTKAKVEISKKGARMPFIEDNKRFVEVMEKFLH